MSDVLFFCLDWDKRQPTPPNALSPLMGEGLTPFKRQNRSPPFPTNLSSSGGPPASWMADSLPLELDFDS
ncbi:MAG: hypothetical protein FD153_1582 [Rhodospirillaceae bacterium]|nr:MAG: hypothetical protein FD153_1582 [Rhodospirillaceae bacterium]